MGLFRIMSAILDNQIVKGINRNILILCSKNHSEFIIGVISVIGMFISSQSLLFFFILKLLIKSKMSRGSNCPFKFRFSLISKMHQASGFSLFFHLILSCVGLYRSWFWAIFAHKIQFKKLRNQTSMIQISQYIECSSDNLQCR